MPDEDERTPDSAEQPIPLPPSLGNGRYRIVGKLGEGGAGQVVRAIQEPLGREVAVKVLHPDLTAAAREAFKPRFLREAAMAGRLSHPNLVTVYDYGVEPDGTHFMVMAYLEGRSVLQRLREEGPLKAEEAARLGAGVARGLHHAHQHGLVHRDVKTSNIVLVRDDQGIEIPILVDFGLAKPPAEPDQDLTSRGTLVGTPSFMAPEQFLSDADVDHRADQYSLGCSLYQMVTTRKPYGGRSAFEIGLKHQTEPYPAMALRAPSVAVDAEFEAIVRRCMEKRPDDRYGSMAEVADALERFTTPAEITFVEIPRSRRPLEIAGAAVVVLSISALVGITVAVVATGWGGRTGEPPPPSMADAGASVTKVEPAQTSQATPTPEATPASQPAPPPSEATPPPPQVPSTPQPTTRPTAVPPRPLSAPRPVAAPRPESAPAPAEPRPAPAGGGVRVKDVTFDGAHAARALAFVNQAGEKNLKDAGIARSQAEALMAGRPYSALSDLDGTAVTSSTLRMVHLATR